MFAFESCDGDLGWQVPTALGSHKKKEIDYGNTVYLQLVPGEEEGKAKSIPTPILARRIEGHKSISSDFDLQFEMTLPAAVRSQQSFEIVVGACPELREDLPKGVGNRCQKMIQRRKPFMIWVDHPHEEFSKAVPFLMDVKGGTLDHIRVLAPSVVTKNKRFDVTLRFEDLYQNLTANAPEETLIDLSYGNSDTSLSWNLFVPETGSISIPNLYFKTVGAYTIKLKNLHTGRSYSSLPIYCVDADSGSSPLMWAWLRGTKREASLAWQEHRLRTLRDEEQFQCYVFSPVTEELSEARWKKCLQDLSMMTDPDHFVSMMGVQYHEKGEGMRQVILLVDKKISFSKSGIAPSLQKFYNLVGDKGCISVVTLSLLPKWGCDLTKCDGSVERLVEIYSSWGSCEMAPSLHKEGWVDNLFPPMKGEEIRENAKGCVFSALRQNHRFGFVSGGYDNRGPHEQIRKAGYKEYSPGCTAIYGSAVTKEDIFKALTQRRCYATTGERILLDVSMSGTPMGGEASTKEKPGLEYVRHLAGFAVGVSDLDRVELIRSGEIIHTIHPDPPGEDEEYEVVIDFDDQELLSKVVLPKGKGEHPFIYYYVRAIQKNGQMAWSSPIWVDWVAPKKSE